MSHKDRDLKRKRRTKALGIVTQVFDLIVETFEFVNLENKAPFNMSEENDQNDSISTGGESSDCYSLRDVVSRRESIDILSSSLDRIVRDNDPSRLYHHHKDSDSSKMHAISRARKDSEGTAIYSLTRLRKDSDASALSVLVKDEEEMMRHEEELALTGNRSRSNSYIRPLRKNSDPFENLRKLSDASDTVYALRKLSDGSDPLKSLRRDSDGILGEDTFKSSDNGVNLLGEMMKLDTPAKDDTSVNLFQNPDHLEVEPTPVIRNGSHVTSKALEHLDALGSEKRSDDESASITTLNDANQKILMDALLGNPRRNRAESWGGMSDISAHQAAFLGNLHSSGADVSNSQTPRGPSPHGFEGVMLSPRSQSQDSLTGHLHRYDDKAKRRDSSEGIPDKIGIPLNIKERDRLDSFSGFAVPLPKNNNRDRAYSFTRDRLDSWTIRDRLDSIANRERLDSLANLSGIFSRNRDRIDSLASLGEVSLTMSLGDLEDVAGKLELVIQGQGGDSDIGDNSSEATVPKSSKQLPKELGVLPAPTIHVDSEAVESAVQAAMAATSGDILDILQINTPGKVAANIGDDPYAVTPLTSNITSKSLKDNKKIEDIQAKARAAAGYVRPQSSGPKPLLSAKKRPSSNSSKTLSKKPRLPTHYSTPTSRPKSAENLKVPSGIHMYSDSPDIVINDNNDSASNCAPSSSSKGGQSNQKWEEMFECLVNYVQEQKQKETEGMSEEEVEKWEWSGNVPTMYKTADGKALGRWINNQRSAKSKGSLKPEREERLISTGLKWSVLTTNAWTDMLEELKVYVHEKTKNGQTWDGNVPTNYKIKSNGKNESVEGDDDKNLGRWINRQRSLYQAGKLKDDRRKQLEEVGLKWAVLSTTSWQTMYDALCEYASSKRSSDKHGLWDGNVPASYETDEKPPKKLGRWVNRQRSAYANKKLKKEFVEKLEKAGLKWTANDCKKDMEPDEVVRQRMLAQSQKGFIRSVPQGIKSGTVVVNSSAGPIVTGKAPITSQKVITNASVPSMNITKVHPSLLKGAVPSSQKSVTASTTSSTTTVTTSRPIQTKVIIPSRSVAKPSTSKVIIPARSLAENGGSISKVVIPARSAASARITKVVIPARSLAQMGSTTTKVTLPARTSIAMTTKAKKVVPPGSIPRSQESATATAKVGTLNSNIPTSTSTSSVKTIDKLLVQSISTPIISKPPSSSTNANPRFNPTKPAKSGSFSNDASISQAEEIKTGNYPVLRPSSKTQGGTLGSYTLKDKIAPAVPLTVSQRSPGKATVNNTVLAPSIVSSQKASSLSIVNNSVSSTSPEAKSPAPTSSTGASFVSSQGAINNSTSAKNSCQENVINGALVSHQKTTTAQVIGTKVAPPFQLRTVSQNSKALDDHTSCIKSKVMATLPRTSGVVHSSRPAEAGATSSSSPKVKNDE